MDSSWIDLPNSHPKYIDGCVKFIEFAKEAHVNGKILCPCKKCKVGKWRPVDTVEGHILFQGFYANYRKWIFHGKKDRVFGTDMCSSSQEPLNDPTRDVRRANIQGLLRAVFGVETHCENQQLNEIFTDPDNGDYDITMEETCLNINETPNEPTSFVLDEVEEAKYRKLLDSCNEELYEGCVKFSKLEFLLHLVHLKCMNHWSGESFTMLLKLLLDAFPQIMEFPSNYYESKKVIKDLGLGYEKIDACPNDCMLYWGEFAEQEKCHVCQTSRWKTTKGGEYDTSDENQRTCKRGEPAKVMRYFPLIPRLKRIYMSSETAQDMRWHATDRVRDGKLRHPADGLAWEAFDRRYPDFSSDPRNVRLGLASDGFNPYRLMSTTCSAWPVVLIPYNLPPWLCMKPSCFILSIIIPGKTGPGNNVDVYLQPLIHELKLLWKGVAAFDACSGDSFTLRAALCWTVNDFPAYGMLSGWSTKGYKACPSCTTDTPSERFGGKICYFGHRRWLPQGHPYRFEADKFVGGEEHRDAPIPATGSDVLRQQERINYVFGKCKKPSKRKRKRTRGAAGHDCFEDDVVPWNKKSCLFELEYWEHNPLRHNLDVMHIEKNVCDNILGTILDMDNGRDDQNARKSLKEKGIRPQLWLRQRPNGEEYMPAAPYSMSLDEKVRFLKVLQKLRVPDGYGSNLSRCVNMKQRKLMNLKSHDNHVLMQDILPVALRASKATKVIDLLADLSSFFKYLCSTTLDPEELDAYQTRIIVTLCEMEKVFLPTFFTIMVHLLIHLVEEAKLGGPVQYRWMYPIERFLADLKSHVTNKARPEGSIAEGFLLHETITFCSRYLEGVKTVFNKPKRIDDENFDMSGYLYNSGGRVVGKEQEVRLDDKSLKQAHRYVLLHSDEIKELLDEFLDQKRHEHMLRNSPINDVIESDWIIKEFSDWLHSQVHDIDASTEEGKLRRALAGGLSNRGKRIKAFMINGYKFQTVDKERYRLTQNSGILVEGADGEAYYGKLKDIYELNYNGAYKVVLFHCDWVDIHRGVRKFSNGGACVNFSKLMHTGRNLQDDPFVFSSQVKQVFYVEDEIQKGWFHVVKTKPRDLFDIGEPTPTS